MRVLDLGFHTQIRKLASVFISKVGDLDLGFMVRPGLKKSLIWIQSNHQDLKSNDSLNVYESKGINK